MATNMDLDGYLLDAILNGSSWTTGMTQDFWQLIQSANVQNMSMHKQQAIVYLRDMENAMTTSLIYSAVFIIVLLTIAIPYNIITVVIVCKNSRFWTQINAILALNSAMQALSSVPVVLFSSGVHFRAIHTYTMESEDFRSNVVNGVFLVMTTSIASSVMW